MDRTMMNNNPASRNDGPTSIGVAATIEPFGPLSSATFLAPSIEGSTIWSRYVKCAHAEQEKDTRDSGDDDDDHNCDNDNNNNSNSNSSNSSNTNDNNNDAKNNKTVQHGGIDGLLAMMARYDIGNTADPVWIPPFPSMDNRQKEQSLSNSSDHASSSGTEGVGQEMPNSGTMDNSRINIILADHQLTRVDNERSSLSHSDPDNEEVPTVDLRTDDGGSFYSFSNLEQQEVQRCGKSVTENLSSIMTTWSSYLDGNKRADQAFAKQEELLMEELKSIEDALWDHRTRMQRTAASATSKNNKKEKEKEKKSMNEKNENEKGKNENSETKNNTEKKKHVVHFEQLGIDYQKESDGRDERSAGKCLSQRTKTIEPTLVDVGSHREAGVWFETDLLLVPPSSSSSSPYPFWK